MSPAAGQLRRRQTAQRQQGPRRRRYARAVAARGHHPGQCAGARQVGELCEWVQAAIGQTVQVGFIDQGYTGEAAESAAAVHGVDLQGG